LASRRYRHDCTSNNSGEGEGEGEEQGVEEAELLEEEEEEEADVMVKLGTWLLVVVWEDNDKERADNVLVVEVAAAAEKTGVIEDNGEVAGGEQEKWEGNPLLVSLTVIIRFFLNGCEGDPA
jgi:hypothetical protein